MIFIRKETKKIESGDWDKVDNPLKNAPHQSDDLTDPKWNHLYSKKIAFYPLDSVRQKKYWPPTARIDNVYGDRNVVCTCPPMEIFEEQE
jgi:Glycine cleavage system protein P (pyridoxal-binding), C-terminal domain